MSLILRNVNVLVLMANFAVVHVASGATVGETCEQSNIDNMPNVQAEEAAFHPMAYTLSLYPDAEHRLQGISAQTDEIKMMHTSLTTEEFFTRARRSTMSLSPVSPGSTIKFQELGFASTGAFKAVIPYLCESADCREATLAAFSIADVKRLKSNAFVSFPTYLNEITNGAVYRRAMSALALQLLGKVESAKRGETQALGNIFDDVKAAFGREGLNPSDAEDAAWKVMAVYSGRGASMSQFYLIANLMSAPILASLGVIGSVLPYLDSMTLPNGYFYSLPRGVSTSCNYSRTYHFWMGAALAREMRKKGYSTKQTIEAVHALTIIYEKFASLGTKRYYDPKKPESFSNGYVSETQKNIAFNDFGALWGATGEIRNYHGSSAIDQGLRLMFATRKLDAEKTELKTSESIMKMFGGMLGVDNDFFVWRVRFAPDAHLPVVAEIQK